MFPIDHRCQWRCHCSDAAAARRITRHEDTDVAMLLRRLLPSSGGVRNKGVKACSSAGEPRLSDQYIQSQQ